MRIQDKILARGQVSPSFIDIRTGKSIPWAQRHNTISLDASRAMALAFGGDSSLIPNRIGIIYGEGGVPFDTTIGRDQSWDSLKTELTEKGADIQIQPFCFSPSFEQITRGDRTGWSVTFHAHSDSATPGAISEELGSSSESGGFVADTSIYQAVLMNESAGNRTILARVSLGNNGNYNTKPNNFEVAIDWTIKFF